ncbi:aminoacyl-tRNA hydrolase [Georgenia sp. 311]|uniref:Peptidyl-tRNA hydrolase n=1 Tax=Georgenia wutianyii TaxID=2585135 RepID=A0ABX5VIX4_9MICO|nr:MULTISPECIES: aminoacyl-tRNA hydrolase [Georgenia]QDB78322.1 aminoacyl-tRNA hydrolase [Georgenia wutianyii]TNC20013.1 aminoacyl-tRNA hydrolase [Georgenia sp. 311]
MSDTWLVVGLGNPGPKYAGNRHNVGRMVIDTLARRAGSTLTTHKARAHVADVRLGVLPGGAPGPRAVLAVPGTFMNLSGGPVSALLRFYDIPAERLLVVHDELDLPPSTLRLKRGGGEGGHNGLRSISSSIGTRDYVRLRVGIGRPPGRMDAADFVLRDFATAERPELLVTLEEAADAVEDVLTLGLEKAQLRLHTA